MNIVDRAQASHAPEAGGLAGYRIGLTFTLPRIDVEAGRGVHPVRQERVHDRLLRRRTRAFPDAGLPAVPDVQRTAVANGPAALDIGHAHTVIHFLRALQHVEEVADRLRSATGLIQVVEQSVCILPVGRHVDVMRARARVQQDLQVIPLVGLHVMRDGAAEHAVVGWETLDMRRHVEDEAPVSAPAARLGLGRVLCVDPCRRTVGFQRKVLGKFPRLHQLPLRRTVQVLLLRNRVAAVHAFVGRRKPFAKFHTPVIKVAKDIAGLSLRVASAAIGKLGSHIVGRRARAFARVFLVQIAVREVITPRVLRMNAGHPVIPVGQLEADWDFANVDMPLRRYRCFIDAARENRGKRIQIIFRYSINTGAACPVAYRRAIQTGTRLIRRIPRAALRTRRGIRACKTTDITGNLHTLVLRQAVIFASNHDRVVRVIELEQIVAARAVAVHAMRLELVTRIDRRIDQRRGLPQLLTRGDIGCVRKRRSPFSRIVLREIAAGNQRIARRIEQIERQHAITRAHAIGGIEAETDRVVSVDCARHGYVQLDGVVTAANAAIQFRVAQHSHVCIRQIDPLAAVDLDRTLGVVGEIVDLHGQRIR
ncbi:hypothetical protein PAMC26577_30110 [Caballeronia sordidicola]|uniref:Uncharacterized protein n=1 Tax=Caballeronia sordidicola TaxID=196367 RepID=A0A242ME44_CABSO|nr:hypothetical protein PAMC26577_30110 [Caballeronia sordidicola]